MTTSLIQVLLEKLLKKGIVVNCPMPHAWSGRVLEVKNFPDEEQFEVRVERDVDGTKIKSSWNVLHPERWTLKNAGDGTWLLLAPRSDKLL